MLVLEKNWIFLKADESLTVLRPNSSKFIKFSILELSFGNSSRCAGIEVELLSFLFWWYFHKALVFRWVVDEDVYFRELPTTLENEGLRL